MIQSTYLFKQWWIVKQEDFVSQIGGRSGSLEYSKAMHFERLRSTNSQLAGPAAQWAQSILQPIRCLIGRFLRYNVWVIEYILITWLDGILKLVQMSNARASEWPVPSAVVPPLVRVMVAPVAARMCRPPGSASLLPRLCYTVGESAAKCRTPISGASRRTRGPAHYYHTRRRRA